MSLAGLMAGRYPGELSRDGRATSSFGSEVVMLAEVLSAAGFRTLGVHGHVYFLGATGISQGFQDWRVLPRITLNPAKKGYVSDHKLATLAMTALDERAQKYPDKPFFAWIHFMDPHAAYARHKEFPPFRR